MRTFPLAATALVSFFVCASAFALDLSRSVIVAPSGLSPVARKAVETLAEEIERRTALRLEIRTDWPSEDRPVIAVGPLADAHRFAGPLGDALAALDTPGPEGFAAAGDHRAVAVGGADDRGVLFGVGYLLRKLEMRAGAIVLPDPLALSTTPKTAVRGHQLGFRPKTNSYDAWTADMWEQYIRELALFGSNAIEIIPPRSDDAPESPHFPLPQIDMMAEQSRIGQEYGQDVWIWYPALDDDYGDPADVEFALREWEAVYKRLPRIDFLFVPGGDPGHTQPRHMFGLLEKQKALLNRYHPEAEIWMSPQGFTAEWMEEFFSLVDEEPDWLGGIVFGPQQWVSLPDLRARLPEKYPIRRYPDITHSRHCQYPVPDWDLAYAVTEGREIINPRPVDQARIFRLYDDYAVGFLTYSEGAHDDVNKVIWSGLGWDPEQPVVEILRDYSRFFLGPDYADRWTQALYALERNWRGPVAQNAGIAATLRQFQQMEREASPQLKLNWRFQQGLYRAYYDAYVRSRLIYERGLEEQAMSSLRTASATGSRLALRQAQEALDRALLEPVAQDLRARVFELAEALYQSVRAQLSVPRYQAISAGRGANLDTIDMPLNDRTWLTRRFEEIAALEDEDARLAEIRAIVDRTNPGPGGFYDDLGDPSNSPHLVPGKGRRDDPAHFDTPLVSFAVRETPVAMPLAWWRHIDALDDAALRMRYDRLDPAAAYKLRVVYGGDRTDITIRLAADGFTVHGPLKRPVPFRPLEFDIPREATADGSLTLVWLGEPGRGGNGRGNQVSEVWLMRAD